MRRAISPIVVSLALVTGFALAETRLVVVAPTVVSGQDAARDRNAETIRRFYAAVNDTLRTGEVASLDRLVGNDLIEHSSRPGVSSDRAGLLDYLVSLHRTAPTLHLTVLDVVAQDDRVAARVRVDGGNDAAFLGLPIATDRFWSTFDVFRLESGWIVEHWADEAGLASFDPLVTVTVPVGRPARKAVTLERWTYAPNTVGRGSTYLGFAVFFVERGTLTFDLDVRSRTSVRLVTVADGSGADGKAVEPGNTARLGTGDTLVVPDGAVYEVRNEESMPMDALVLTAITPMPTTGPGAPVSARPDPVGSTRTHLAGGLTANLPSGDVVIAIGRAALAAWTVLPAHVVDVAELIAVEEGDLALSASGGEAWVSNGPMSGMRDADSAGLPPGGGALIQSGASVVYRNAGASPLGIVLVTFRPRA
jgi:predicted SnoaL-like aldol condensation-catalyzing enzyme